MDQESITFGRLLLIISDGIFHARHMRCFNSLLGQSYLYVTKHATRAISRQYTGTVGDDRCDEIDGATRWN